MSDDPFRRFRCWTIPVVQNTIFGDIASLKLDADAVFLAAHTSLDIEHIEGVMQPDAEREVAVLRALDSNFGLPDQNTLIAVTGPSGSGKSHLVRWVRAQLPETADSYHLIYVPKALETLRQLLGHILDRMPSPESEAVKAELDKAVGQKRPEQLGEELLDRLRSVLGYELPDVRQGQEQEMRSYLLGSRAAKDTTRRVGGLSDLLLLKPVRDHLLRPGGAIGRIVDSLRGQRRGDEETPEFDASDLPIKQAGVASQLHGPLVQLWSLLRRDPVAAVALLNEGRNRAVAEALGMRPGVNLGEVLTETRRRLRSEDKELVLLFEDLAQFGLFDGDLYDHFSLQPGEDLAPIRALFAITDGKFDENVPPTVQTRLTHHFKIGNLINEGGNVEDKTAELVSRYLNIARVGRQRLIAAWDGADTGEREAGTWIPNACLDRLGDGRECINRDECWSSFGRVGDIGLYPYNNTALRRDLQKRGDAVTARMLVDRTVKDFLIEANPGIGNGSFPGEGTRDRFDFNVSLAKESIVPEGTLSEPERDRLHRCRVIWADGRVEKAGITVAFDLPNVKGVKQSPPVPPPDGKTNSSRAKPTPLRPLFAWQNGEEMLEADAVWYRERLHDLVRARVDLASLLIDPGPGLGQMLLGRALAPNSFELTHAPGQPAGRNRLRFPIEPDDAGVLLLSAVRWWWDHGHWITDSGERKWDFPLDAPKGQLTLDEFLESAARDTEGAIVAMLTQGPLDAASAAVALRASAITALGYGPTDDATESSLDWVFASPSASSVQASPSWEPVAIESLTTLSEIDARWVAAFASARQGDTGEPLCVDAARLLPAAHAAARDPLHTLAGERTFDQAFSEITQHWETLNAALANAVEAESRSLAETMEAISQNLSSEDFAELIGRISSAGQLAADNNVFRPQYKYSAFRDACDQLREPAHVQLVHELEASTWLRDGDRTTTLREVMGAQRWAATARSIHENLNLVRSCLVTTAGELSDRLVEELGGTPEAAATELSVKVKRTITMLAAVFEGRET